MFKSISDSALAYKRELIAYLIWIEKNSKKYGEEKSRFCWGKSDFDKTIRWEAEVRGIEKALGLTKEECEIATTEAKAVIEKLKKEEKDRYVLCPEH